MQEKSKIFLIWVKTLKAVRAVRALRALRTIKDGRDGENGHRQAGTGKRAREAETRIHAG